MRRHTTMLSCLCLCLVVTALVGCNDQIRAQLQAYFDDIWSSPVRKAEIEARVERRLHTELRAELDGHTVGYFWFFGWNRVYINDVISADVALGDSAPTISVPGQVRSHEGNGVTILFYDVTASWDARNAELRFRVDISHGVPDHTVRVRNLASNIVARGMTLLPHAGNPNPMQTFIYIDEVSVPNLIATARGSVWFLDWDIDVSAEVRAAVRQALTRRLGWFELE